MKAIVNANVVLPDRVVPGGCVLFEGDAILASGRIDPPEGAEIIDAGGLYAGPGFVDEHTHGYHGRGRSIGVIQDCDGVAAAHLRHGTTTMTPSAAYNYTWEAFTSVIRQCNAAVARGNSPIAGVHFEGPYTNPRYGSLSDRAWTYSREACEALFDLAGANALHCTYAPELPCAPELEDLLARRGVIPDIGHTCASPEDVERAVDRGARIVTHLFDAMGHHLGPAAAAEATGDVQASAAVAALATPGLYYELICDSLGAHVTRWNAAMTLRAAGEDRVVLITDCSVGESGGADSHVPATSAFAGATDLNFDENGALSGSYLTMDRACANFMRMTGADVRVAFKCAATNPARALKLDHRLGSLEAGKAANIVLTDGDFNVHAVWFRGRPVDGVRD